MRQFVKATFAASLATALVMVAALLFAGSASAGVANTKHNLGSDAPAANNNSTSSTGEICVFCHTPHGSDTGNPAGSIAVPLWNKVLTDSTFQTYDQLGTSTLDAGVTDIGSISIACLTCHDGTQAIDNILNAPGSGGYDTTGGGNNGLGWDWSGSTTVDANGLFNTNAIANIGTDLRNDHPVSVQYGGGGISASDLGGPLRDGDFVTPDYSGVGGNTWWIDNTVMEGSGSTANQLDKWDFKLYTRVDGSGGRFAGVDEPFVECGSCHDPHLETTTFLRIDGAVNPDGPDANSGSRVCLACHTK